MKTVNSDRKKQKRSAYKEDMLFRIYDLAKVGTSDVQISKTLGIDTKTLARWRDEIPAVEAALRTAREVKDQSNKTGTVQFQEYVYRRLPENLQTLWDRLMECDGSSNGMKRREALLQSGGLRARQHLFVHALVSSNFNASKACGRMNISKATLDNWMQRDPDFADLLDQVHWHKKNFFESHLMDLIVAGDPKAILMVNQTVNADRGYGKKVEVAHTGEVKQLHEVVSVDDLELPLDVRRAMLAAIRSKQKEATERRLPIALSEAKPVVEYADEQEDDLEN
jgi:hypothetical protein